MKALLIGFGSIGKRHFEILKELKCIESIDIISQQTINGIKIFRNLADVDDLNIYDYFVIASETEKHYVQLNYICSRVSGKKILVEKPLYEKNHQLIKNRNKIFVAYNLRFHSVIEKLRYLIDGKNVYYVNAICGQYLPTWRPDRDYRQSYSASTIRGGGVLRDLSHELDYLIWMFGSFDKINAINAKISDLEIESDDIFTAIAITSKKIIINLTIDYISKEPIRRLLIHVQDETIEVDIINNIIRTINKQGDNKLIELEPKERNYSYCKMHQSILVEDSLMACNFEEGLKVMDVISTVKFSDL